MKAFKRKPLVRYNARTCLALTHEVVKEINFVYTKKSAEEDDEEKGPLLE
jgi:hypothetical protein